MKRFLVLMSILFLGLFLFGPPALAAVPTEEISLEMAIDMHMGYGVVYVNIDHQSLDPESQIVSQLYERTTIQMCSDIYYPSEVGQSHIGKIQGSLVGVDALINDQITMRAAVI